MLTLYHAPNSRSSRFLSYIERLTSRPAYKRAAENDAALAASSS